MPPQEETKIRKIEWCRVIQELRKAPLTSRQLEERGISRRTVYRALEGLRWAGVVEKKGGRWYWCEFLRRTFDSHEEYELAMKHSDELCPMLNESILLGESPPYQESEKEVLECVLEHLKNGYPELLEILTDCKIKGEKLLQREEEIKKGIEKDIKKSKLRGLSEELPNFPGNIALVIVRSLKDIAQGRRPFFEHFRVDGESLFCGAYRFGPKESEIEVRGFVEKICKKKRNLGEELTELDDEYFRRRSELTRELIHLVNLIKHGTPLFGNCDLCPKIKINPLEGEISSSSITRRKGKGKGR